MSSNHPATVRRRSRGTPIRRKAASTFAGSPVHQPVKNARCSAAPSCAPGGGRPAKESKTHTVRSGAAAARVLVCRRRHDRRGAAVPAAALDDVPGQPERVRASHGVGQVDEAGHRQHGVARHHGGDPARPGECLPRARAGQVRGELRARAHGEERLPEREVRSGQPREVHVRGRPGRAAPGAAPASARRHPRAPRRHRTPPSTAITLATGRSG